ncbi:hypothetical protein TVAG_292780 [Trichomonas vaginalis G3]|uniref:Uncharacterized protein n=1 Tax=Trichomonas vaginalis (strain ATCC PRA-98 / G3) TaxID=412133 RepID=A2F0F0_TRIV3|nr:tyrosine phosphatase superdomain-containing protein [Trichomonas vaginalis G3]EAY01645.1 hypothetical protein TVAG_292780 [Trichomonas vaginalis G3]KAI5551610.1 tyrosine phosphatase superdomain-containing protein [Trichomonas vaginalis G3]|eukprot:XP_001330377.1 hypothetical protein [Trichomonas vaginalis G3]
MRKKFEPPKARKIPAYWINTPTHSTLYAPKEFPDLEFIMMKTPMNPKLLETFPPEYKWTFYAAASTARSMCPQNTEFIAINVAKKGSYVSEIDWKTTGIHYEEIPVQWGNTISNVDHFYKIVAKYKEITQFKLCFLVYSSRGYDKPAYLIASALLSKIPEMAETIFTDIKAVHPPGFLKTKALRVLSHEYGLNLKVPDEVEIPEWYFPLPVPDSGVPPIPLLKVNFPGLQEIGATSGNGADANNVRKILGEYGIIEAGRLSSTIHNTIWSSQLLGLFETTKFRVTFEPEGSSILILATDLNFSYVIDKNGEVWIAPIIAKTQLPLICRGILQKKRGGSSNIFLIDIMRCGQLNFAEEPIDNRISYLWSFVVENLSTKDDSKNIEFIVRTIALLKNASDVYKWISKMNFRCSGITLVPIEGNLNGSIFIPLNGCLIPFQASLHDGQTAIIYSNNNGEMVPVSFARIDAEATGIDGRTVYAYYSPEIHNWVIKKYSRDLHRSNYSYVCSMMKFFDTDAHTIDVLKFLVSRFSNL